MFIVRRNEGKNREDVMKGEEGMERSRYAKEGHRDGWKKGKEVKKRDGTKAKGNSDRWKERQKRREK